jgi:hypothetical protein
MGDAWSPRRSQARAHQPSGPRTSLETRHARKGHLRTKNGVREHDCWYAAVRDEHVALLEPIEEDEHSDLIPLMREMPQSGTCTGRASWPSGCHIMAGSQKSRGYARGIFFLQLARWRGKALLAETPSATFEERLQ